MHDLSNVRKAIAAALTGIATWSATAQVDGIDTAEWWGLFGVLVGAFLVWLAPNQSGQPFFGRDRNQQTLDDLRGRLEPYDDEHTTGSDAGAVSWAAVALLVIAAVLVLWAAGEVPR